MPTRPTHFVRRHAVLLAWLFVLAGCAAPPAAVVPGPVCPEARLVIVNLAAQAWEVSLAQVDGAAVRVEQVPSLTTRDVALPAGHYAVEQVLLDAGGNRAVARRFEVRFEPGRTLRWPLAILEPEAVAATGALEEGGGQ